MNWDLWSELCRIRDNSNQGCQFTSQEYKEFLKKNLVRQSMDGKSRWADNIRIERWFRLFKYEEAYLTEWHNIKEAYDKMSHACNPYGDGHACKRIADIIEFGTYEPWVVK